ncbi:sensor histidine kinase [Hyphomicrobium sp.]|uniref:sensor histidine kinase n=1 Tax=Hyphomicrobium sp. TaxID=82 RepID=UPI002FDD2C90
MHNGLSFLLGGGRAAEDIRQFDWAASPLGPMRLWPQSLKTALSLMLLSRFPKAIAWGRERITFHNDAFRPILGDKPPAIGRRFSEVWAEVWPAIQPMIDRAFAGEPTFIENYAMLLNRRGYPEQAYFTFCYSPIHTESGSVGGMMDTVIETTETVLMQHRLAVINAELSHRMRNLLTMVSAITTAALPADQGASEFRDSVSKRLTALAQCHSFLSADAVREAPISELIERAFAPHPELLARVHASGPELLLKPSHALALSLALNELMTNSLKYGALAGSSGTIAVRWDPAGFNFAWHETGIASADRTTGQGFGTKVLMQFVPASFNGQARIEFKSDGVYYELMAPPAALKIAS